MPKCERILLVEDDADLLDTTAELIEQLGISVVRCRDATTALEALRRGPAPNLIVLDMSMPRISGEELLRMVRAQDAWKRIPVVAMSGYSAGQFPDLAVDAFISKPFDAEELERAVKRLCGTASGPVHAA